MPKFVRELYPREASEIIVKFKKGGSFGRVERPQTGEKSE
jgi:hypothetical protein